MQALSTLLRALLTRRALVAIAAIAFSATAPGQGCVQCRDNAAATPPKTRAAYQHAIELLVLTAGSVFAGAIIILKRSR